MDTFPNIPPSDLLFAYLAGELDDVQESALFRLLADNAELRTELRDHMFIDTLVQRDADSITLPPALKQRTLGAVAARDQADTRAERRAPLLWPLPRIVATAVVSAVLGGLLAVAILHDGGLATTAEYFGKRPAQTSHPAQMSHSAQAVPETHHGQQAQSPTTPDATAAIAGNRAGTRRGNTAPQSAPAETVEEHGYRPVAEEPVRPAHPVHIETVHRYSLDAVALPDNRSGADRPAFASALAGAPGRWRTELRGTALRSLRSTDVAPQSGPWFSDMSAGLYYDLSPNHSIGIEAGQEAFAQVYSGTDNGRPVRHEQHPLLLWVGGAYQYTFDGIESLGGIRPFGRVIAGGTATGPLARCTAGIQYQPDARVTLSLGAEGGVLLYRFQDTWFTSEKIGLTYGISLTW